MSDIMRPVLFEDLLEWLFQEYPRHRSIFGIPREKFYFPPHRSQIRLFGQALDTPLGPAAGPHTQLANNIVAAYLTGGRFIELKTVQKLDRIEVEKPCIDAQDEGYNVEWSQELTLDQSYDEYLKAWFLLHLLRALFGFSAGNKRGFIFNMSVGYDLEGIKTERMNRFIDELIDASANPLFARYQQILISRLKEGSLTALLRQTDGIGPDGYARALTTIESISPHISDSVTISTMHGCPPDEIEAISRYLIREKKLNTYVKLNPTLLGYHAVRQMLDDLGYRYIALEEHSFANDLQFGDAVPMLRRLQAYAADNGRIFGVKLSNTLGVNNRLRRLPGDEMYMSGRSLFPLTINLARRLAEEFDGRLNISFSGGAWFGNVDRILHTGIFPVTMVTDLLKPGGYARLQQMAKKLEEQALHLEHGRRIDLEKLGKLAEDALRDDDYRKEKREVDTIKIPDSLPQTDCFVAPCQVACPIHQDVAEYIGLVEQERYPEAFEVIVSRNPLPFITGHICDHECQNHCTRWDYESPVLIRDLKRVAAEQGFETYLRRFKEAAASRRNGKRVAVIGAGPSGLSAAYFLAKGGFDVTVFDRAERPGGIVQNVIPDFRLPQSAIDNDVAFIKMHGVRFRLNSDEKFSVDKLKREGFHYIYIAIGAQLSKKLKLAGDKLRIYDALDFLRDFREGQPLSPGTIVAVVGGGNSAMDASRAALRVPGVEKVYIIYRRTLEFMPADREEYDHAIRDGVVFRELLQPVAYENGRLKCQKMRLGERDTDGRRKVVPVEGEFEYIPVDSVVSAIGEQVDVPALVANGILFDEKQHVMVNRETHETLVENVFIGGDALRGPSSVVQSIADGRKTADAIIRKEGMPPLPRPDFAKKFDTQKRLDEVVVKKGQIDPPHAQAPVQEAARCLACNFVCNKCEEVCPNRANVPVVMTDGEVRYRDRYQILHLDGLCNECGNCETFCPYNGSPYKDKITLFWTEEDFRNSGNEGFLLLSENGSARFRVRFGGQEGELTLDGDGTILSSFAEAGGEFEKFLGVLRETYRNYRYLFVRG